MMIRIRTNTATKSENRPTKIRSPKYSCKRVRVQMNWKTDFDTSNLKRPIEPPKIEDAKCNHRRMERPEESRPPRYRNSLRLATMAAAEKEAKAKAQPTKAPTRMLQKGSKTHT
ncbi:transmembrane protein 252 [Striga asiatica]|uniref:Transmembrane protein 252 n=1 Tax=Striga asiatica TaxID=4170 RepID=A0A5A7R2I1_STRAF|nr:transmembrane protein 252 [Striga asiatica]